MILLVLSKADNYYREIEDAVINKRPFKKFRFYYHLLTEDKEEEYYSQWIDYLLDSYSSYRRAGYSDFESQVNSLSDGLEELLE